MRFRKQSGRLFVSLLDIVLVETGWLMERRDAIA